MSLIFISPDISLKAQDYIKSIIFKFNAYVTSNLNDSDLIICNNVGFVNSPNSTIPRISFTCFKSMIEQEINPLTFQYKTKFLGNLFLRNKSFMFYRTSSQKVKQCTKIIESMCGTVTNDDADYCLTEEQNAVQEKQLISVAWIFALQYSSVYISPDSYFLSKKINQCRSNKKSFSQKTLFPGQLQIYCSDKQECPIIPRILSKRKNISSSQSIRPSRSGQLSIFVFDPNMEAKQKVDTHPFTQKYISPPKVSKNKQNIGISAQAKSQMNIQQFFKLDNIVEETNELINDTYKNNDDEKETENRDNTKVCCQRELEVDFIDQLTSFSQGIKSDEEDDFATDVSYEADNKFLSETESESEANSSHDPIILAFS